MMTPFAYLMRMIVVDGSLVPNLAAPLDQVASSKNGWIHAFDQFTPASEYFHTALVRMNVAASIGGYGAKCIGAGVQIADHQAVVFSVHIIPVRDDGAAQVVVHIEGHRG